MDFIFSIWTSNFDTKTSEFQLIFLNGPVLVKKKLKSLRVFKNPEGSVFKYGVNIYHIQS